VVGVLIGLVAWFGISLALGLWLGPGFKRSSQARDAHLSVGATAPGGALQREGLPAGVVPAAA
jgi:hypothetical protein